MTRALAIAMLLGGLARAHAQAPSPERPAPDAAADPVPDPPVDRVEPRPDPAYGEAPDPADGGGAYFAAPKGQDIVILAHEDRSNRNVATLVGLGAGGVVFGGIGLYFHLDSRSATRKVEANRFTGQAWSADREKAYDRAHSSSVVAGVFYGLGGALVLATAIMYIATEPKLETIVIHPHGRPPTAILAPTPGGALVGGTWSF